MKLNKKKILCTALGMMSIFSLTGCGIKEMSDSETKVIAQYAADVLMHYDASYYDMFAEEPKIKDETVSAEQSAEPKETKAPVEQTQTPAPVEQTQQPSTMDAAQVEATGEQATAQVAQNLGMTPIEVGNIFGLDKVEISYKSVNIVDKYPEAADNQLAFQMEATQGQKLLVVSFNLYNTANVTSNCNILGQNVKFRVCINDTDNLSVQKTLLLDDLSQMNITLQPNESKNAVAVCQVPADYNPEISSLSLIVRTGGEDKVVKLK